MATKIKNDKILLATACFLHLAGISANQIACDGLVFNDIYFDKEVLVTNLGRPYNLVFHQISRTLFFSHTVQVGSNVDFAIMSCHIVGRVCTEIKEVPGGYAVAYDAANDDMYFGGHDGIYKYNFLKQAAEYFAEEGKSIWGLFIKKNFYYIQYPTQKLFVYQDNRFELVPEAIRIEIDHFFVSNRGDVYFSNSTALYKVDKVSRVTKILNDEIVIRQIVEDRYGDVYFCAGDGIYTEDKPYNRVKKIADISKAFSLTFDDNDNVIYSDIDTIYRLLPSASSEICYHAIKEDVVNDDEFKRQLWILLSS